MSAGEFDGAFYATSTAHHRAFDEVVLEGLDLRPGMRVVDVGCGVGDLTRRVHAAVQPGGTVLGVDASASVLDVARAAARPGEPGPDYRLGRAQDLGALVEPSSVDAVLSVAALHWVPAADQASVLGGAARALRPGGRLRIDMGGRGQLAAVVPLLDAVSARFGGGCAPWCFPAPEEHTPLLEGAGFDVSWARLVHQRRQLGDADGAERWLRSQVLPAYTPTVPEHQRADFSDAAVAAVVPALRDDAGGGAHAVDYVRLDVLARRR